MAQLGIFVSHSSTDKLFADSLVRGLRDAGADVWYDEQNLGAGVLRDEIMRELSNRPVFVVLLSSAAFTSPWVRDECEWAYNLYRRKPQRLILPVAAAPYDSKDFDRLLYLESMKRIEGRGHMPLPQAEAVERTLKLLALTAHGQAATPATPQPTLDTADSVILGQALVAQRRYQEAITFLQQALQRDPENLSAWFTLGMALEALGLSQQALGAYDQVLTIDPNNVDAWSNKGNTLASLGRREEAVAAFDRALTLDPTDSNSWAMKGALLGNFGRREEALAAIDRALALDPDNVYAWGLKGGVMVTLGQYEVALVALDRAQTLVTSGQAHSFAPELPQSDLSFIWSKKGAALTGLGRRQEALAAFDSAVAMNPDDSMAWAGKGSILTNTSRYGEALVAWDRLTSLQPNNGHAWAFKAKVLRALGRDADAQIAERRAKELGV